MRNILTIIKKELIRVFKDPRLIIMVFLFPGLMIYGMYSLMGSAMFDDESKDTIYYIESFGMPDSYRALLDGVEQNFDIVNFSLDDLESRKAALKEGSIEVIIIFENDFETKIAANENPNVQIFYNPSESKSTAAFGYINSYIEVYRNSLVQDIHGDVSMFVSSIGEIFEENKRIASYIAMLLPFLILTFLFSGAMSVAPESIAGEKERGTMATLLVTPTKRSEIALGKIISLSIISTISAISSFIGIILSLPKIMGMSGADANIYGVKEYLFVLAVLVVTVLIIVSLISIISAFAKNVKEASMYVLPLMLVSMAVGLTSMFGISGDMNNFIFLIPLYNSVQILGQVFTFEINTIQFIITIASNIVYTGIFVYLLTLMFNNEKIMFSK